MKKTITKTVLSIAVAASIMMPGKVSATYPTIDFTNLLEAITQNYQDMQNWAQERMMMMAEMDLESALSSLGIDAQNNAMTNMMVREGRRDQTIQNIQVMEWSIADSDACDTIATQLIEKEVEKRSKERTKAIIKDSKKKHNNFAKDREEWTKDQEENIEEAYSTCLSLVDGETVDNPLDATLCTQADLVFGGGSNGTLNVDESKAAEQIVSLLTGVTSTYKESVRLPEGKEKAAMQLKEMRLEAFRSIAQNSLNEVSAQFKTDGDLDSPFATLKLFDKKRYKSDKWMAEVQNVSKENKNAVYISEITRKIAVMNAFLVHMEVIKYEQQLRMESLQAAMLALEVEPL